VLRRAAAVLPAEPGVYRFRDDRARVIYVGRATELRARVRSYAGDLADRPHLRRMVPQVARVEALVCASGHEAAWLERNLLERSLPRWNRVRGGLELIGWLAVRADAGRPGLDLVVDGPEVPCGAFGPYLGVERLALARSALLRAWPLPLTGARLDVADRSLAEARAVGPGDRDRFADRLRAVLRRESPAVAELHDLLLAARDRAVAQLAFETAAQVQAEVAAVAWLASPQRVAGCTPGLVVSGWADGVLVTLRGLSDRLDHWTARRTPQDAGERAASQTPQEWRAFAARNATLAAALVAADA
jgi:excinuclease ABC subunit C